MAYIGLENIRFGAVGKGAAAWVMALGLALVFLGQPTDSRGSVFYDAQVIASNGVAGITGFLSGPSLNERGLCAFPAQVTGGQSVFAGNGAALPVNLTSNFISSSRTFSAFLQVNNSSLVVAQDRVSGPSYFIRLWDATVPGKVTDVVRSSTGGSVTVPSLNDYGQVAYLGLNGSTQTLYLTNLAAAASYSQSGLSNYLLRPMIADNGWVVGKYTTGPATIGEVRVYTNDLSSFQVLAAVGVGGWTSLDSLPGISRDGLVVAFEGDRGSGPGIFACVWGANGWTAPIRVAGEVLANPPADLGFDDLNQRLYLTNFPSFSRVGVAHAFTAGSAPGTSNESFEVCFIATPSAASRTNSQTGKPMFFGSQAGIWTVRVDALKDLAGAGTVNYYAAGALPVAQVGELIAGQTVTSLVVQDPIANATVDATTGNPRNATRGDHRVAFLAGTAAGGLIVLASHLDTDGDG